jgi:DNA-binding response OmpR family regulator
MARKKILLVDDAETMLMMERMFLQKGPYELVTAKNGEEAVEKAVAERPDLILLDIVMPKMDGLQACARLRERAETKAIPIFMVTTRGEADKMATAFESGCTDYITKPINGLELLTKVKSVLGD